MQKKKVISKDHIEHAEPRIQVKIQAKVIADLKLRDIAEDETDSFDDLL